MKCFLMGSEIYGLGSGKRYADDSRPHFKFWNSFYQIIKRTSNFFKRVESVGYWSGVFHRKYSQSILSQWNWLIKRQKYGFANI